MNFERREKVNEKKKKKRKLNNHNHYNNTSRGEAEKKSEKINRFECRMNVLLQSVCLNATEIEIYPLGDSPH